MRWGSTPWSTLAHRVAHLVLQGVDPQRILLLTFTRRAALEMTRRAERIVTAANRTMANRHRTEKAAPEIAPAMPVGPVPRPAKWAIRWAGTFHSIANRLLRIHGTIVGLEPSFTIADRADAADLMDLVRSDLQFDKKSRRFPKKASCLAIYSYVVNAQTTLAACLAQSFPWCEEWEPELRQLFRGYVEAKQERQVLDYDDLLLYLFHLMEEPVAAAEVGAHFDHILVDEYQDTNVLQAQFLRRLAPTGSGLSVVGDDAQAIYSFRAASVRNILEFPEQFATPAKVIALTQNYRSIQSILDCANALMSQTDNGFGKSLTSQRSSRQKPILATVEDEMTQVDYVIDSILHNREAGVTLRRQAVLFRAAHHSDALEIELARRNIPFVKYGGLRFLEAAHIKDVLGVLRWAENPRDSLAAFRVFQLLPGIGPAFARRIFAHIAPNAAVDRHQERHQEPQQKRHGDSHRAQSDMADVVSAPNMFAAHDAAVRLSAPWKLLRTFRPPTAAQEAWPRLCALFEQLTDPEISWQGQLHLVRNWYQPLAEDIYDDASVRMADIEQLEHIAGEYRNRERFLSELVLNPPQSTGDHAGPPVLDEDYLILSTIHSAKGQEWDAVFVLNCVDGCIPSDLATGDSGQIDEERRLLYVAMTRARNELHLIHPLRMYVHQQRAYGDRHVFTPLSRFLPESMLPLFERRSRGAESPSPSPGDIEDDGGKDRRAVRVDVATKLRQMW